MTVQEFAENRDPEIAQWRHLAARSIYIKVKLTGINTPLFGASWEYTDTERGKHEISIEPGRKIRVF